MKFTSNSAMARQYEGASKRMLDEGFEAIDMPKVKLTQADVRLGQCDDWELRCQDFADSGYDD